MSEKIRLILNDRESGSIALLNRLISALEEELHKEDLNKKDFRNLLLATREKLKHFAAIYNFLEILLKNTLQDKAFPANTLGFIRDYSFYWQDSDSRIAENFLHQCNPAGLTILTHSHSETVISLMYQLHERHISFRVMQTLSSPGKEGLKSHERLLARKIQVELIADENTKKAVSHSDLIVLGCDALLENEFLNKVGTHTILELAKPFNKRSILVTESRKEVSDSDWKRGLKDLALFEWTPLDLLGKIVTERKG